MARSKSKSSAHTKTAAAAAIENANKAPNTKKYKRKVGENNTELLYGKDFYVFMLIGLALIALGFVLMAGGNQDPNEWNANEIYSFRRTTLAPIVLIAGLVVEIYAIFKK